MNQPLPRVLIETQIVSQLDGKRGIYAGEERGYVRIDVEGFQHPILFKPEELKRLS